MIYFDKVTKKYQDGIKVISDVSLTIEPEEFVSIVGHSGAGKTTLLRILLGKKNRLKEWFFLNQ